LALMVGVAAWAGRTEAMTAIPITVARVLTVVLILALFICTPPEYPVT
jgi:hypothetical protein